MVFSQGGPRTQPRRREVGSLPDNPDYSSNNAPSPDPKINQNEPAVVRLSGKKTADRHVKSELAAVTGDGLAGAFGIFGKLSCILQLGVHGDVS